MDQYWLEKANPSLSSINWINSNNNQFFNPDELCDPRIGNSHKDGLVQLIKDSTINSNMIKYLHDCEMRSERILLGYDKAFKQAIINQNDHIFSYFLNDTNWNGFDDINVDENKNYYTYKFITNHMCDMIHGVSVPDIDAVQKIIVYLEINNTCLFEDVKKNFVSQDYKIQNSNDEDDLERYSLIIKFGEFPLIMPQYDKLCVAIETNVEIEPLNVKLVGSFSSSIKNKLNTFEFDPQRGRIIIYGAVMYVEKFSTGYNAYVDGTMREDLKNVFDEAHLESKRRRGLL